MKVLMIAPYVTITSKPEFSRNKTGFGYMVYDIAKSVAVTEQVDMFCTDSCGDEFTMDNIKFISRKHRLMLRYILSCVSYKVVANILRKYRLSKGLALRLHYYWLLSGYLKHVIKNGQYDIVHMHGCTLACEIWQHLCDECGVKIVFTLHGLNSFSDTVRLEPAGKQYERVFLKSVTAGERKISVISTGIKKLIERTYQTPNCSSISVVCNAFSFQKPTAKIDVRKLYNIPDNSKIILYVGNVSVNKNQAQLVSSFNLLEKTLCDNTYILFVGNYKPNDDIVDAISNSKYKEHLILCGNVDKSEIGEYYRQADGVALLSISEGFGLSLIEGLHFGLPCMMFSDIDAFSDIYSPDVAVAIEVRRDTAVAAALTTLLTKPWNHDDIKTYSKKFESDEMARQYINFYKQNLWE